jgi:hypothetical protein
MDFYTPHQTNYIKTEGDFTYTRESTSPWIDYSYINKELSNEQLINLTKPTMNRQHKIVVFTVKRNEKNEIISSKFYKEGWIEVNGDQSINLIAAKQFDIPVDLFDSIVVKKINEVTL